ncbi:hypothetical protein BDZ45DRAFT_778597 [Acephala macrosclerotiorum]|nr:hypothetical protein BDZ45DRAFT_778597 [Acephala macrosclerotiorum]
MGWRGVTVDNVFIGNFFFVAGIGMVISAQWELVLGNSFGYTALSAFGFFYRGFGAILTPLFSVQAAYGDDTVSYNNALGFFVLMWVVLNLFFLFRSLPMFGSSFTLNTSPDLPVHGNLVYIGIFGFVELAFTLIAVSYFAAADGKEVQSEKLKIAGGVFAFLAGLLGYYTVAHLMYQEALFFRFPMGDTSRFFVRRSVREGKAQ